MRAGKVFWRSQGFSQPVALSGLAQSSIVKSIIMVAQHFEHVLRTFQKRQPFKSFSVELMSGTRIEVDHPEALVLRGGVAVYIDSAGVPVLFDHHSVGRVSGQDQTPPAD
jgi:hypothetical protein